MHEEHLVSLHEIQLKVYSFYLSAANLSRYTVFFVTRRTFSHTYTIPTIAFIHKRRKFELKNEFIVRKSQYIYTYQSQKDDILFT